MPDPATAQPQTGHRLAIAATIVTFRRHSTVAAALLVPYLAWVTYAGALDLAPHRSGVRRSTVA